MTRISPEIITQMRTWDQCPKCGGGKLARAASCRKCFLLSLKLHPPRLKHGDASRARGESREYISWSGMRQRCYYPKHNRYQLYGGRGVTVCERWRDSYENFLADMGRCPEGCSLDRIDANGNYEPTNCRWATRSEQARNQRVRTHCPMGHELAGDNLYIRPNKANYCGYQRVCRTCRREKERVYRAKLRIGLGVGDQA